MAALPTDEPPHNRPDQPPPTLTPAERNLLFLTLLGQTPAEMSASLGMGLPEVEQALGELQKRFGVSSQRKLLVRALLQGWHQPLW